MIMDWAIHDLTGRDLDSSTVKLRFGAAFDIYDYARTRLGFRHLANPLRDPEVLEFGKILGANYKKRSKARCSVPILVARAMLAHGWDTSHRVGRWGRLRWTLLNLGMLRVGGLARVHVAYTLEHSSSGSTTVHFLPESDISILYDETLDMEYININVDIDKNVKSWNRRSACIPDTVPALGALPVAWLRDYLAAVQPPSGGPLLAKPTKRGFALKAVNASADIKRAYKRACTHGGLPYDDAIHTALGTHSGRKSLAQWLWDDGHCRRIIADAGGWFLKRDAVDMYFKTARHIIIKAVKNVGALFNLATK